MTMRTMSRSGDQILSCPIRVKILNLLLSNALLSACALIAGHAIFAVIRDAFCNYCIPHEQLAVCKVTRPLFLMIEGCDARDNRNSGYNLLSSVVLHVSLTLRDESILCT